MNHRPDLQAPGTDPFGQEPDSALDVKEYLHKLRRHWRLIALVALVCTVAGVVMYFITPKLYTARAVLQIERRSLTPLLGSENPWLENWFNLEFYPTQERLLQSRGLAERVVRDLDLVNNPSFESPRPEGWEGTEDASAALDEAALARIANRIRGGLSVRRIRETQLVELTYTSRSPEMSAKLANGFAEAFIDQGIDSRFENAGKASTFIAEQIETLKREISERELQLQDLSRRTDIVDLDPQANTTIQRLRTLDQDYSNAKNDRIEMEARYRELLALPAESVADSFSGGEVSQQRSNLASLRQDYNSRLNVFKPEWPEMVELKSRIETAEENLRQMVEENAALARETARAAYQAALRKEQTLDRDLNALKSQTVDQKSSRLEIANLEDEVRTRRELLNELLRRQSETDVASRLQNSRASNVRIVDTALVPGGASHPSLRRNVGMGLLAGLLLGIGLALLLEYLDRTLKSSEELERILGLPTLAVIPDISHNERGYYGYGNRLLPSYGAEGQRSGKSSSKSGKSKSRRSKEGRPEEADAKIELLPYTKPRLAIAEAYRSLRTALLLSSAQQLRAVTITSAEAGEGKTATAANLAVVMAQLGRNVLIVDGDLRKPRQHQLFRTSNRSGLVNHLVGDTEAKDVIFRTEIPHLYICPSGPTPPNPSELLSSKKMTSFLDYALERFDFVVIDTPPTLAVTDSTLLGALTDGVVLCCRAGKLQREEARACRDRLHFAEIRILGAVLNRFRPTAGSSSYARKYRYYESYMDAEADSAKDSRADSAA
ncbi:MAG: polysaccharide biosynthesis tyrosine autokinase [Acidobacteriota bacterium]|nr:polysaccharide biosynthesis tyrosine autokinase [Acidobacteriota bacterium]